MEYQHADSGPHSALTRQKGAREDMVTQGCLFWKRITQCDRTGKNILPPLVFYYSYIGKEFAGATVRKGAMPNGDLPGLD
ncbi:MAG: hypothetical protein R3F19_06315 [Verrucomicrobiales bacterium]